MICLFGGTFDPVHVGHLHAARSVCDALGLDQIRLVLSAHPGHRGEPGASVADRWVMLELACTEDPRLVPDPIEVRRAQALGRPSYTVETLQELRRDHPDDVLGWVVGSDAYREIPTWYRWRDLFELTNLVVLNRPGAPLDLPDELAALTEARRIGGCPEQPAGGVLILDLPMLPVSATAIRRALAAGDPSVADLLSPAVYTYIRKYHLYGVVSDP